MTLTIDANRLRGRPFQKGVSGNPAGRPSGSRNKATLRLEALLDSAGEALLTKLIEQALEGSPTALRTAMKILFPKGRKSRIEFALPQMQSVGDCLEAHALVLKAATRAELALDDALDLSALIDAHRRSLEEAEFAAQRVLR